MKQALYRKYRPTKFDDIVFDFAIANGDATLLNKVKARKYLVHSYSVQPIEKFITPYRSFKTIINELL